MLFYLYILFLINTVSYLLFLIKTVTKIQLQNKIAIHHVIFIKLT